MQNEQQQAIEQPRRADRSETARSVPARSAPVDIFETKDEILIVADFPGVPSAALAVNLDGTSLTIEGRQEPGVLLRRSFQVPNTVDGERVAARCVDGVLTVQLPKRADAKARRIEVKAG
jgi:HSP20 family protein